MYVLYTAVNAKDLIPALDGLSIPFSFFPYLQIAKGIKFPFYFED